MGDSQSHKEMGQRHQGRRRVTLGPPVPVSPLRPEAACVWVFLHTSTCAPALVGDTSGGHASVSESLDSVCVHLSATSPMDVSGVPGSAVGGEYQWLWPLVEPLAY